MSVITIRLSEKQLSELDAFAKVSHVPRAEYIRLAIALMNNETKAKIRAARLKAASLRVRHESMKVNEEFSNIERDPKS